MADPLSIISATAGIIDICVRVGRFVKELEEASRDIREEIKTLKHELSSLENVNRSIEKITIKIQNRFTTESMKEVGDVDALVQAIHKTQKECESCLLRFEAQIAEIVGKDEKATTSTVKDKFERIRKAYRKKSKEADFAEVRESLSNHQSSLQISFLALSLCFQLHSQDTNERNIGNLSEKVTEIGFSLRYQIASLQIKDSNYDFWDSISCAAQIAGTVDLNVHFYLKEPVSRHYIGRQKLSEDLAKAYFKQSTFQRENDTQMCFVVQGLGGSGKTQFCCKFAQDNRKHFWGVFYIDASSEERAKASFQKIAKLDDREGDTESAKDWLSSLNRPWLLMIDNAHDPKLVEQYIPSGQRGFILITTRNPVIRNIGNIGPGFYQFETMDPKEARELLLVESGHKHPWESSLVEAAGEVAMGLGFLPLALVHAGKAILKQACRLAEYLGYYETIKKKIREEWQSRGIPANNTSDLGVYSSYDILFKNLEDNTGLDPAAKDAIDLLRIFSFFYYENLSVEILVEAATNPVKEREEQNNTTESKPPKAVQSPKSLRQVIRELAFVLQQTIFKDQGPPNVPPILRAVELGTENEQEFRVRLNAALSELSQRSLITLRSDPDAENQRYSMHPLVHEWVRQRPQMTHMEQAVRCQEALSVLSRCVLLPPLGEGPDRERIHRELLPHLVHAEGCRKEVTERFKRKRVKRPKWKNFIFSSLENQTSQKQVLENGKFGLIYLQCGHYSKAKDHFLAVRNFLMPLGLENERSRRVTLALSMAYFFMGAQTRAAELQREALEACERSLGRDHPDTLDLMDKFALTLGMQGWLPEALEIQKEAIDMMCKKEGLGPDHQKTLSVIDHQGETLWKLFRFEDAMRLHERALIGLEEEPPLGLGPRSPRTLEVKHNLALACLELTRETQNEEYATRAHELMIDVFDKRQKVLGKEHPWTLLAAAGLAQAKSELNDFDNAEALFRKYIPIGDRTVGGNHLGAIGHGRFRYAQCLFRQKKYAAAESMFLDVLERYRVESERLCITSEESPRGNHPDLIYYRYHLMACYQEQGKIGKAIGTCHELVTALKESPHPIKQKVLRLYKELLAVEYKPMESPELRQRDEYDLLTRAK